MYEDELKSRMKQFALRVIALVESLLRGRVSEVIGKQLLRCATSVGANYRAACRAKSSADFVAKLAIVEEEADEAIYWLELLGSAEITSDSRLDELIKEADEFVAIAVSSIKTIRAKRSLIQNPKSKF